MTKAEILQKQMSYVSEFDKELEGQTIHVKGQELSVKDFAKTLYKKALDTSFEADAEKYYAWKEGDFDEQFLSYNCYLVVHYYKDIPELCYVKNNCFHRYSDGKTIRFDEVLAAKRIEYPEKYLKEVREWQEENKNKLIANHIADSIMGYGEETELFAKKVIAMAKNKNIDLNSLIDELCIQGGNYDD